MTLPEGSERGQEGSPDSHVALGAHEVTESDFILYWDVRMPKDDLLDGLDSSHGLDEESPQVGDRCPFGRSKPRGSPHDRQFVVRMTTVGGGDRL